MTAVKYSQESLNKTLWANVRPDFYALLARRLPNWKQLKDTLECEL